MRPTVRSAVEILSRRLPTGLVFGLLASTLCAFVWFGVVPLPLGGPDVVLGLLTGAVSLTYLVVARVRDDAPARAGPAANARGAGARRGGLRSVFAPGFPVVLCAATGLLIVALLMHLHHGLIGTHFIGPFWMALAVGMLLATALSVNSLHRVQLLMAVFIFAVFVSSVYGLADFLLDPYQNIPVPILKRLGGLTHERPFLFHVGICVPWAFAVFVFRPHRHGRDPASAPNYWMRAGLIVVMAVFAAALVLNATRAAILGAAAGVAVVVLFAACRHRIHLRRALGGIAVLIGCIALLVFLPDSLVPMHPRLTDLGCTAPQVHLRDLRPWPAYVAANPAGVSAARLAEEESQWFADHPRPVITYRVSEKNQRLTTTLTGTAPEFECAATAYQWQENAGGEWRNLAEETTASLAVDVFEQYGRQFRVWVTYGRSESFGVSTAVMVLVHNAGAIRVVQEEDTDERLDTDDLALSKSHLPHNQVLEVGVRYGLAGIALLLVFYIGVAVSLRAAGRSLRAAASDANFFMVAAVTGGLVSHWVTGLFHPTSIFTGRWEVAFVFGVAVAVRSVVSRKRGLTPSEA